MTEPIDENEYNRDLVARLSKYIDRMGDSSVEVAILVAAQSNAIALGRVAEEVGRLREVLEK